MMKEMNEKQMREIYGGTKSCTYFNIESDNPRYLLKRKNVMIHLCGTSIFNRALGLFKCGKH